MSDINNQVSKKVTYTAYSPYEFDRRLSILKEHKKDVEEIIRTKKVGKHRNKSLKLLLAAVFGLLSESLASRRGDKTRELAAVEYIEARYRALSSFFFSSYETDSELTRRSLALIDALGDNAELFLRTRREKFSQASVPATQVVSEKATEAVDIVTTESTIVKEAYSISEDQIWEEMEKARDCAILKSEIKKMFPEVVEDPSGIIALANKLGTDKLLARVRRSYIFNSKD